MCNMSHISKASVFLKMYNYDPYFFIFNNRNIFEEKLSNLVKTIHKLIYHRGSTAKSPNNVNQV